MENTTNESQSTNAAKVIGFASAITLVGVATIKAKRFVGRKLNERRTRLPLTTDA